MFNSTDLLSARNLILASAAVFVLSMLGMCVSMLRPQDSGGLARDSYGTRGGGHRALVEILEQLDINVTRSVSPPQPNANDRHTLVLLEPNARLVAIGPKYAQALRKWIEGGGRVVVAPSTNESIYDWSSRASGKDEPDVDILSALGIDKLVSIDTTDGESADGNQTKQPSANDLDLESGLDWDRWNPPESEPVLSSDFSLSGTLAPLATSVKQLALPGDGFYPLAAKPEDLAGSLTTANEDDEDKPLLLVAVLKRGAGEIVVVADPSILSNGLISKADNSVLAVNLLSPQGNDVVFDEFYHGLSVRGNPLYLLTRPGFAAVAMGLITVVGVLSWRLAVFLGPPLGDTKTRRRDIGEYVRAMAEFFSRGRGSRRFIVREVRDGVLRQVCREMRLPMDTLDVDVITSALSRRDRNRAERLAATIREVDAGLDSSRDFPSSNFLPVMQRLASCL
jgi:hypothetical protein